MFKALQPLLTERSIHILLSAKKDGKIGVYVEPVKKDEKEDNAFVTPFRCEGTADELNAELPVILAQWLTSRTAITTSLSEALAAAEAQTKAAAEEAKKKAAEKNKKPTLSTPAKAGVPAKVTKVAPAQSVTPSLLDGCGDNDDEDDEGSETAAPDSTPAPAAVEPVAPAPVVEVAPLVEVPAAAPVAVVADAPAPAPAAVITEAPAPAAVVVTADPVTEELF